LNGKDIDAQALRLAVGSMAPGAKIDLKVIREGSERSYALTLDAMPDDNQRAEQTQPAPRLRRGRG